MGYAQLHKKISESTSAVMTPNWKVLFIYLFIFYNILCTEVVRREEQL